MADSRLRTQPPPDCPIFGKPCALKKVQLPLISDVFCAANELRFILKNQHNGKEPSWTQIRSKLIEDIVAIWSSASVPTVSVRAVTKKMDKYHDRINNLKKYGEARRNSEHETKIESLRSEGAHLFDICSCSCKDNILEENKCKCPAERKVPQLEVPFLIDQRSSRKLYIGSIDTKVTYVNVRRHKRKLSRMKIIDEFQPSCSSTPDFSVEIPDDSLVEDDNSPDYIEKNIKKRNYGKFSSLAIACDRTKVSDRTVALIATATLEDAGLLQENSSKVIDKNKVRRERKKTRESLQKSQTECNSVCGIFFDGRKDLTLTQFARGGKTINKTIAEEHVSVVGEPGSKYLTHITPQSGSAEAISEELIQFIQEANLVDDICVIGCDGTNVNTGSKGGVIARIEQTLNRSVQWSICLLHLNELPLRHLITKFDGKTAGPTGFTGVLGKKLIDCEIQPLAEFEPVPSIEIEIDENSLSSDQKYLLKIYRTITSGLCNNELLTSRPGNLNHSRWLTTASRFMRLYISTEEPSEVFMKIIKYIVEVYVPTWFQVKRDESITSGAINYYSLLRRIISLTSDVKDIVEPVLSRNAYFAHHESILLAMVSDDETNIRRLGWRRIYKARQDAASTKRVRAFTVPKVNFQAQTYIGMVDWQSNYTEPPMTKMIPNKKILELMESGDFFDTNTRKNIPCHTQAVERQVKLVTEASRSVCGKNSRDGMIRSTIQSRRLIPKFGSKQDYVRTTRE